MLRWQLAVTHEASSVHSGEAYPAIEDADRHLPTTLLVNYANNGQIGYV